MAAESEMSAFIKIRKAATEREWCPERPSAVAPHAPWARPYQLHYGIA